MIRLQRVTKRFGSASEALSNVSLRVDPGAMAFITGPSGAGKSTLLRLIAGLERPTRGRIRVNGHDLDRLSNRAIPGFRRSIGLVFQDHRLLFDRPVFDNVALPLEILAYRRPEMRKRVRAALDKVGLLHKEGVNPRTLSAGEQQRVGIARAIVHRPVLLLADEPTGNLDPALSREILQLFDDFNRVGMTALIASHDLGLVERMGKPVLHLEDGRIEARAAAGAPA
ncbi:MULTISPECIES: cell division ATP-binding protein FtsE [Thioalkalivibrio]|uniref:Cell division ATP-binding protein FtsE n=1 Tax=Thioalkalivibrio versutus TaxID=106634 RepID=A0A0G3G4M3_9GAMM|nr:MULTISPECIES: cell division ATP-binding protein FtsE [Thioalkalivibrio]AKJ96183.1 cell division protein FtsE [Thioalkalivibrio versutus]OOC50316.1 cell division ATP-binding protein FtsE [Thioalkalivibrio versutus]